MKKKNSLRQEQNNKNQERRQHLVQGQVQGVGFRPFVFRLAHAHALSGFVSNTSKGVCIEVQGSQESLNHFETNFNAQLPPLAKISSHQIKKIPILEHTLHNNENEQAPFFIKHSDASNHDGHAVLISPDSAICSDCQTDLQNIHSHHYAYPFTNCTNCGPRYTITKSIPYDRAFTSMACFKMCETCQKEYDNPLNRRFHAQPNACEICGPKIWLKKNTALSRSFILYYRLVSFLEKKEASYPSFSCHTIFSPKTLVFLKRYTKSKEKISQSQDTIAQTQKLLAKGKILAIKALGGFQLACDAYNVNAIQILRERKNRPHKAFAIMVENLDEAKKIAHISKEAEKLLCSPQAPIVLCPKKQESSQFQLPQNIAPDTNRIGIMLAYTPLHKLLFQTNQVNNVNNNTKLRALIMTSANTSGEPICIKNRQALQKLAHITDYFLFHNRDILVRVDDSVCLALQNDMQNMTHFSQQETGFSLQESKQENKKHTHKHVTEKEDKNLFPHTLFFRRARGYVPSPSPLPKILQNIQNLPSIFAAGAFLKNTFCLTRQSDAFVSQHMGDLDNLAVMEFYEESYHHLKKLLEIQEFKAVICDTHPDFPSTHFAQKIAKECQIPLYPLQHHFAHAYAVLAEQEKYDVSPTLALVLDGTGHGLNGTSWGAELLYIDPKSTSFSSFPSSISTNTLEQQGKGETKKNTFSPLMLRLGRLAPMPLIGGESAIKEPWRIAYGMYLECIEKDYINQTDCNTESEKTSLPWHIETSCQEQAPMLHTLLQKNINCPRSSGCGRIFDAISALLGLCSFSTYEGQAPIKLEALATQYLAFNHSREHFPFLHKVWEKDCTMPQNHSQNLSKNVQVDVPNLETLAQDTSFKPLWEIDSHALFAQAYAERMKKVPLAHIAYHFHANIAHTFAQMACEAKEHYKINKLILCGGVMNNELLRKLLYQKLYDAGFDILLPKNMPSGDGAISLGQAFYGILKTQAKEFIV